MTDESNTQDPQNPPKALDLSVLSDLSFGPKWSDPTAKRHSGERRESHGNKKHFSPKGRGGPQKRHDRRGDFKQQRDSRHQQRDSRPQRPAYQVSFYPEDEPFLVLTKAIRTSCKTYELFEIAHLILQKPERFIATIKPLSRKGEEQTKLYACPLDGMPFESEAEALAYGLQAHVTNFFNIEETELEAPKGSFPIVNKCGITNELLGPPNYHRYQELLRQHYENNLQSVPYDRFLSKIESVKEEDQIQAWIDKMKVGKKYILKGTPEGVEPTIYNTWEEARSYITSAHKKDLVRTLDQVRFSGKLLDKLPNGAIKHSIEAALNTQREFPLDTANNLRGRLRRMKFAIYKKGAKGVSYVSAVKRKFRDENSKLTESLQKLIEFIEKNPNIGTGDLPSKYLGIAEPEAPEAKEGEEATPAPKAPEMTPEQQKDVKQLMLDLRWLVSEGYVTEYGNGTLYAQPVLPKAKPKEDEGEKAATPTTEAKEETPAAEETAEKTAPKTEETEAKPANEKAVETTKVSEPESKAEEAPAEPKTTA